MLLSKYQSSWPLATGHCRVQSPIWLATDLAERGGMIAGEAASAAGSIVSRFVRKHHPRKHVIETSRDLLGARMADAP